MLPLQWWGREVGWYVQPLVLLSFKPGCPLLPVLPVGLVGCGQQEMSPENSCLFELLSQRI